MNGMTLTGSRIYYALGQEHRWFAPLGRWNERRGTPIVSLFVEAGITGGAELQKIATDMGNAGTRATGPWDMAPTHPPGPWG